MLDGLQSPFHDEMAGHIFVWCARTIVERGAWLPRRQLEVACLTPVVSLRAHGALPGDACSVTTIIMHCFTGCGMPGPSPWRGGSDLTRETTSSIVDRLAAASSVLLLAIFMAKKLEIIGDGAKQCEQSPSAPPTDNRDGACDLSLPCGLSRTPRPQVHSRSGALRLATHLGGSRQRGERALWTKDSAR